MKRFKSLRINMLATSIVYVLLGLVFIIWPEVVTQSIAVIVGVMLALAGVVYIIDYFRKWDIEYRSNGLAIGILLLFGALLLLLQSNLLAAALPILLGFAVVVSGTVKLQNAVVLYKAKERAWVPVLVMAGVSLIFGIIIMVDPFTALYALIVFIGVALLISGLTDLAIIILMAHRSKQLRAAGKPGLEVEVKMEKPVKVPAQEKEQA